MKTLENIDWFKCRATMRLYENVDDPNSDWIHVVLEYYMQANNPWNLTVELIQHTDDADDMLDTKELLSESFDNSASAYKALQDCITKAGMDIYGYRCFVIPLKED